MRKLLTLTTLTVLATAFGSVAAYAQPSGPGAGSYGPGYGMMGGYGYGYGPVHMIVWAVVLIAIIVGVVWMVRSMTGPHAHHMPPKRSSGLDVLEERYARGEVTREEYLQKKKDILG
ncbi:MAG: SHOCT domain-containing protein [Hyphomicrobium sp.]|nr:SHOCT domain-containing protein [Hyphomicrobium sp.]